MHHPHPSWRWKALIIAWLSLISTPRCSGFAPLSHAVARKLPPEETIPLTSFLSASSRRNDQEDQDPEKPPFLNIFQHLMALLQTRWNQASFLEIRLDATLLACYVLSRFLVYDIANSTKTTPGWVLQDWIYISSAFSSAILLSFFWTLSGVLVTGSFDESNDYSASSSWKPFLWNMINVTVAAPLWLATEQWLHFGPPGMAWQPYTPEDLITSGLGLAVIMIGAKTATAGWR